MHVPSLWAQPEPHVLKEAFLGHPSLWKAFPFFIPYGLGSQVSDYYYYVSVALYYNAYVVINCLVDSEQLPEIERRY